MVITGWLLTFAWLPTTCDECQKTVWLRPHFTRTRRASPHSSLYLTEHLCRTCRADAWDLNPR